MIGVLIIAHGDLGDGLLHSAAHVMGKMPEQFACMAVSAQDDPLAVEQRGRTLLEQLDSGDGVLIFTDIFGATPSNVAGRLIMPGRVAAIAGVSLPMLVRALTYRSQSLRVVMDKAVSGGHEGIVLMEHDYVAARSANH